MGIAVATLSAALVGLVGFRESPLVYTDVRITITDVSGASLENFFADIPPKAKISETIKEVR